MNFGAWVNVDEENGTKCVYMLKIITRKYSMMELMRVLSPRVEVVAVEKVHVPVYWGRLDHSAIQLVLALLLKEKVVLDITLLTQAEEIW